jgi:hypothetical protein
MRTQLSSYMDGDLEGARTREVSLHLEACAACSDRLRELARASEALSSLPRLHCPEPLAARVLDRLEVESRGPGLALLFRSAWNARPLFVPSILPAALVLVCTLSVVFSMGTHDVRAGVARARLQNSVPVWGTEAYPFWTAGSVQAPESETDIVFAQELIGMSEQSFLITTLVNQDGKVSDVRLLEGDSKAAEPILAGLRQQRFRPGRVGDRAVSTRDIRLYTTLEVRAPLT